MIKRADDPEDLKVENMRENSVSKNWLIGLLTAICGALLLIGIGNLNAQQIKTNETVGLHAVRIERLEESKSDVLRRLESMDSKLDKLLGWKG